MAWGDLPPEGESLDLTTSLRHGLTAISVLAFISFFSSTILFSYLAYKLAWHFSIKKTHGEQLDHHHHSDGHTVNSQRSFQRRVDFALGIDGVFDDNDDSDQKPIDAGAGARRGSLGGIKLRHRKQPPNQFLVLIFNLLLADMHQAMAFLLNTEWLRQGTIDVRTRTCFAQGFFVSTGDLASSCFITTIAIHTYLSVVRRYMMPHRVLYMIVFAVWLFVYAISTIPIGATHNGAQHGGFFVRAGAWCWMNDKYSDLRLVTHYLFIFIGIATTAVLYIAIFVFIRRQAQSSGSSLRRGSSSATSNATSTATSKFQLSHNPAFLIYPVIYILCTLPLAVGRISSMANEDPPLGYMCFAGALIASNGMFDCMLFGTTRNVIVFASKHDVDRVGTGLDTFLFMQTPRTRRYGNMVWVQGGGTRSNGRHPVSSGEENTAGGWWSWQKLGGGGVDKPERVHRPHHGSASRSVSQESLRGPAAIQMDTVTTVVVEVDERDKERRVHYPDPSASTSPSVNSTDTQEHYENIRR